LYAEVVVDIPAESAKGLFHYAIPAKLEGQVKVGSAVLVPFGTRELTGYVVGFTPTPDVAHVKDIRALRGDAALSDEMMALAAWMSCYYTCSLGEAIAQMFPSSVRRGRARPKTESLVELAIPTEKAKILIEDMERKAPRQAGALRIILEKGPIMLRRRLSSELIS
jgi:primosomal protein N' (replication factor Y)